MNQEELFVDIRQGRLRAWTLRLHRDYDQICFTYRVKLEPPVFRIEALKDRWGSWDEDVRTLTLAERLLTDYPWEMVLEILKHEMAHQLVCDLFTTDHTHGPLFHRACDMLAVAHWARRAETEMGDHLQTSAVPNPEEDRLLSRAQKLLALAGSSNEHEAFLAMKKVQELYAKYNLDRLREKRDSRHTYLTIKLRKKRVERHQSAIASLLNDHFFVRVIQAPLYDVKDNCEYKVLELLGTTQNVKMAEYVFHFLSNQLALLWRDFQRTRRPSRRSRMSFFLGVIEGFREKLERSKAEGELGAALVLVKDPELGKFVENRYPRLIKIKSGGRLHDSGSFTAGKEHGERLVLHRGIKQEDGFKGKLLR